MHAKFIDGPQLGRRQGLLFGGESVALERIRFTRTTRFLFARLGELKQAAPNRADTDWRSTATIEFLAKLV